MRPFGLDQYIRALNPKNVLGILPKELMLSHIQGFFFREKAGVTLFYDEDGDV